MDPTDIIAILLEGTGFIISIIGLVVTPLLNLKSKRLEKRLEYRFQLFEKVLEFWAYTHKNQSIDIAGETILLEINKSIQLYGYNTYLQQQQYLKKHLGRTVVYTRFVLRCNFCHQRTGKRSEKAHVS